MTLIEKMARAAYEGNRERFNATEVERPEWGLESWEDGIEALREDWRQFIRDGLKAMRGDPGHDITAAVVPPGKDRSDVLRIWNALIDAALKEEEGK